MATAMYSYVAVWEIQRQTLALRQEAFKRIQEPATKVY